MIARGVCTLIFETLAECTLALAQLTRKENQESGYGPLLDDLVCPVLARCLHNTIPIVSNFGAANPLGAARRIAVLAQEQCLPAPRIATIHGDDLNTLEQRALLRERIGPELDKLDFVSANAYIGATEIAQALRAGVQVVVAGRVADPSLALGRALAHFDWAENDWRKLGRATIAGHLLECGTQVSGGYFCVPGLKDVPDLYAVGFSIAQIDAQGNVIIGKADHTGGRVDSRRVKEQFQHLLSRWLAEISYAGVQAEARARLAADIVRKRIGNTLTLRVGLIGSISVLADDAGTMLAAQACGQARDVRLHIEASHAERGMAERVLHEVTALYTCGLAGDRGVRSILRPRLNTLSYTIDRAAVKSGWVLHKELTP